MIHEAVQFIDSNLNDFLKAQFSIDENTTIANNLVDIDGKAFPENINKVVLTLFNLYQENFLKNVEEPDKINQNRKKNFSFYLLLSSNFIDYSVALQFLNTAHSYLEANVIFNEATSPNFPLGLSNIELYLHNTTFEELYYIWTTLGAKYVPSAVYKVRIMDT